MKKVKYLLFLMLIAVLAVGVLAGCSVDTSTDLTGTFKVVYCGNGGELNANPERVFMIREGLHAFDPASGKPVSQVVRPGYKFVGWAKGKLDENGDPVILDAPITDDLDGGVYRNKFGAIRESAVETDQTGTVKKGYYDYDRNSLWNFDRDLVTEDICLVAVWDVYSKFLIADKNESGEWESYDDLLSSDFTIGSGAIYEKYEDRLYDVQNLRGTRISQDDALAAYGTERPDNTVLKFYKDPDCSEELVFPFNITNKVTVIYYEEIDGVFDLVTDARTFQSSYAMGNNIYMQNDIDMKDTVLNLGNVTYSGEIRGNGHSITNVNTAVTQNIAAPGEKNSYGGMFGKLINARISDLTIDIKTSFTIAIDPDDSFMGSTANDKVCYFGLVASLMDGCIFRNFNVNVEYELLRSLVDGEGSWVTDPETGDRYYDIPKIKNKFDVTLELSIWAPQTDNTNLNVFNDNCSVTSECVKDETEITEDEGDSSKDQQDQGNND